MWVLIQLPRLSVRVHVDRPAGVIRKTPIGVMRPRWD